MRTTIPGSLRFLATALVACIAGCDITVDADALRTILPIDGVPQSVNTHYIIGGSEKRVLLRETPGKLKLHLASISDWIYPSSFTGDSYATKVISLDLQTLERQVVRRGLNYGGDTDGDWFVWHDDSDKSHHVLNLDTGTEQQTLRGISYWSSAALNQGRLLTVIQSGPTWLLLVLELTSGKQTIVKESDLGYYPNQTFLGGDILATSGAVESTPDIQSVDLSSPNPLGPVSRQTDFFNLSTGERHTVPWGLLDSEYDWLGSMQFFGTRFIWWKYDSATNLTTVFSQAADSSTVETIATTPSPRFVAYNGESGMMTYEGGSQRVRGDLMDGINSLDNAVSFRAYFQQYGGDSVTLVDTSISALLWDTYSQGTLVGPLALAIDPSTNELVIYDTVAKTMRRTKPFDQ